MKDTNTTVIGSFERVSFPHFAKIGEVTAKIDTGAFSGALHCTKIRVEDTASGKILHFSPFDHPEIEVSADNFSVQYVKSSNGTSEARYFITTEISMQGKTYPIFLSLADRSEMKWPMLIGRRFLKDNRFLVDVNKSNP